jgi:hypothetical protein
MPSERNGALGWYCHGTLRNVFFPGQRSWVALPPDARAWRGLARCEGHRGWFGFGVRATRNAKGTNRQGNPSETQKRARAAKGLRQVWKNHLSGRRAVTGAGFVDFPAALDFNAAFLARRENIGASSRGSLIHARKADGSAEIFEGHAEFGSASSRSSVPQPVHAAARLTRPNALESIITAPLRSPLFLIIHQSNIHPIYNCLHVQILRRSPGHAFFKANARRAGPIPSPTRGCAKSRCRRMLSTLVVRNAMFGW